MSGRNWFRDDPIRDAEDYAAREAPVKGICEHCGQPIYDGDDYYDIEDTLLHEDCLRDWAEQYRKWF